MFILARYVTSTFIFVILIKFIIILVSIIKKNIKRLIKLESEYDDAIFDSIDIRTNGTKKAQEIQEKNLNEAFESLVILLSFF